MTPVESTLHAWIIRISCAFSFLLPISAKASAITIALLISVCALYKFHTKKFFRFSSPVMLFMMLFYVLHITGLLNTSNFSYAALDLQIKASFLLMPLFIDNLYFSSADFRKVTRAFIAGCSLYALVLLFNATLEYFMWKDRSSFFYIDFSSQRHVAYFTLYINCALFFLYDEFLQKAGYRFRSKLFILIWIVFLLIIVAMLSSRMAVFATFITFTGYILFHALIKNRKGYAVLITTGAAFVMIMLYIFITGSRNRFESKAPATITAESYPIASSTVQNNVRFTVWRHSFQVYSENPLFGTGTGDIKDELRKQYAKSNFREGLDFNLSPHNQFLHTLTALGLPGFLALVILFLYSARHAIKTKDFLLLFFITAVMLNCLTEGILEKQDGVLFFVFFLTLIVGRKRNQEVKSAII